MVETVYKYFYLQCVKTGETIVDVYGSLKVWDTYEEAAKYLLTLPDPINWNVKKCGQYLMDQ